jgi:uncharacterized protein YndB with AHSA1/START domain
MKTRFHMHQEIFDAPAERLFALLVTPSAIRGWWGASRAVVIAEHGGIWAAAWGDEDLPDCVSAFRIRDFQPPRRLFLDDARYFARSGSLAFNAQITAEFTIGTTGSGSSLRVVQAGFPCDPAADGYYAACETGWRETFKGIRRFLSGGERQS